MCIHSSIYLVAAHTTTTSKLTEIDEKRRARFNFSSLGRVVVVVLIEWSEYMDCGSTFSLLRRTARERYVCMFHIYMYLFPVNHMWCARLMFLSHRTTVYYNLSLYASVSTVSTDGVCSFGFISSRQDDKTTSTKRAFLFALLFVVHYQLTAAGCLRVMCATCGHGESKHIRRVVRRKVRLATTRSVVKFL